MLSSADPVQSIAPPQLYPQYLSLINEYAVMVKWRLPGGHDGGGGQEGVQPQPLSEKSLPAGSRRLLPQRVTVSA